MRESDRQIYIYTDIVWQSIDAVALGMSQSQPYIYKESGKHAGALFLPRNIECGCESASVNVRARSLYACYLGLGFSERQNFNCSRVSKNQFTFIIYEFLPFY